MKVVHIDSGLGNQMLSYCEYLALKKIHPNEPCYIETILYNIQSASETICQWNGYELNRVFGIDAPNIRSLFTEEEWKRIHHAIQESRFWEKNWNWPIYFNKAFQAEGLILHNLRGNFEEIKYLEASSVKYRLKHTWLYTGLQNTKVFELGRQWFKSHFWKRGCSDRHNLFYAGEEDALTGQRLTFMLKNNGIEEIADEIKSVFHFNNFKNDKNKSIAKQIEECEAVSVHVRRGDMMFLGSRYFKSGYFCRAVNYIKNNVEKPEFFIFCDPDSIEWCKKNHKQLGLNVEKDRVYFIDWNLGKESYRDMQLMSLCKHNIITNSSFGWWGAYLNRNPDKITISSEVEINTTQHV